MIGKPPAIDAWITMLRTTQLPQTCGSFQDSRGYCGLGIFCLANGAPPNVDDAGNWSFVEGHITREAILEVAHKNDLDWFTWRELADWADDYFADPSTWAAPTGASQS